MTKKEILKIIEQNKDILTTENYKGVIKNIDIFTDAELKAIVDYLNTAKDMIKVNNDFMKAKSRLYQDTNDELDNIEKEFKAEVKKDRKETESKNAENDINEAENLISNL